MSLRPIAAVPLLRLAIALVLLASPLAAQRPRRDPAEVRIITTDISHFWEAFDARASLGTSKALDSLYFGRATPGLEDFRERRLQDAAAFARMVDAASAYYASTRASMARIDAARDEIHAMLRRFVERYPEAVLPDIYVVVGRLSTGGTTGPSGLLIGAEMYGRTGDELLGPPLSEWHRAVLRPVEDIVGIVAHELVHYQQAQLGPTLLGQSMREGIADFVGEMVSGQNINRHAVAWSESRQAELWPEFQTALDGTDLSRWLFNGNRSVDRPADLGYVMGYRVAKAWYARQPDPAVALRRLLRLRDVDDARALMRESGYAPDAAGDVAVRPVDARGR